MTDKFAAALEELKDALTNGDPVEKALEEVANDHNLALLALRNRATLAWGDLTALGKKNAATELALDKIRRRKERHRQSQALRIRVLNKEPLTEAEWKVFWDWHEDPLYPTPKRSLFEAQKKTLVDLQNDPSYPALNSGEPDDS